MISCVAVFIMDNIEVDSFCYKAAILVLFVVMHPVEVEKLPDFFLIKI